MSITPWPSSDAGLLICEASFWQGDTTLCRWCNGALSGRRQRWCSDECSNNYGRNHWWSWASRAAKKRDNDQCVICLRDPREVYAEKIAAGLSAHDARRFLKLETDHIVQVLGRHSLTGCHHHLDGLRTLCAHHHLERHHGERKPTDEQLRIEAA